MDQACQRRIGRFFVDAGFAKLFLQNGKQLTDEYTVGSPKEFESERNAVFVSDAVAIRIFPAGFVQQFRGARRIVRIRFQVRVVVG